MSSKITCPNCGTAFDPGDALSKQNAQALQEQMQALNAKSQEWQQKREEDFRKKENTFQQQLQLREENYQKQVLEERERVRTQTEEFLRKQLSADHDHEMKLAQEALQEKDTQLKAARTKELELLKKEQALQLASEQMELTLQRRMMEERTALQETLKQESQQRQEVKDSEYKMKLKELEEKLEAQRKLADEMKRKAEQGSMQLQGEVQELELEEVLRQAFPYDKIAEIGKGKRGADCVLQIHNQFGNPCGSILFESKRTKDFSHEWIEKLKAEMRASQADVAIIVTQAMPKDLPKFGQRDGVWICTFQEVKPLVAVLRDGIIRVHQALASNDNKGEKMTMLYDYLTSREFQEQWNAIREGFMTLKTSLQKERDLMERLWKAREKQLDKVLLNAAHIRGSIEGISGMEQVDLNLLEGDEGLLLE